MNEPERDPLAEHWLVPMMEIPMPVSNERYRNITEAAHMYMIQQRAIRDLTVTRVFRSKEIEETLLQVEKDTEQDLMNAIDIANKVLGNKS